MNNFSVRNASRIELNTILGWAALEGWNPGLHDILNRYNMKKIFETARMYTKEAPRLPINKIFGVTTFELG